MTQFGKLILAQADGQEQEYVLEKSTVTLGRSATSDITLADGMVSRAHARLDCSADGCTLTDLNSANGISVNGKGVARARLAPGDIINVGNSTLRFVVEAPVIEPVAVVIDSEEALEVTLKQATVAMTLTTTDLPRLVIHTAARTWEMLLTQETISIGRYPGSDLVLDQAKVSRHHARLERAGQGFRIRDLESTNGTWLGVQQIDEQLLHNGDTIRIGDARLVFKGGYELNDLTLREEPRLSMGAELTNKRSPVVFVPGMMGSELWRGSERIWPNVKLLLTQPEIFRLQENDAVEPRGIVNEVVIVPNLVKQQRYSRLGDYLEEALGYERNKDLLEFAYDFRQDNRISARRLAETIDQWPVTAPITLIAHSLGCIVSRYYVERLGGKHKIGRLILLGGPNAGYPKAVSHLLLGPNMLPFGLFGDRMRQALITYPSIYQILPTRAFVVDQASQPLDLFADTGWLSDQQQPFLRDAQAFRRELGVRSSVPTISIFGYGMKTTTGVRVQRTPQGVWQKVDFELNEQGDIDIPTASAILDGSEIHPVQQHHGSLYVDNDVKMRLKLELTR
jgi:pSer/pThr/pTyr-binding forkhead associated (FHA) protein